MGCGQTISSIATNSSLYFWASGRSSSENNTENLGPFHRSENAQLCMLYWFRKIKITWWRSLSKLIAKPGLRVIHHPGFPLICWTSVAQMESSSSSLLHWWSDEGFQSFSGIWKLGCNNYFSFLVWCMNLEIVIAVFTQLFFNLAA